MVTKVHGGPDGGAGTEMGPGIAAEPHCAELEFAGLRFVPRLRPEGEAPAIRDPCSPAQASRRSRSAAQSPGLLPRISAPKRTLRPTRRLHPALPSPPGSSLRSEDPRSMPFRFGGPGPRLGLVPTLPCGSVFPVPRSSPVPTSRFGPGKPVPARSATVRPFAALLGMIGLSRCPEIPCGTSGLRR